MHRSGTSFLARALNLYGVHLGDLESLHSHEWKHYDDNPRGHWENKDFFELAEHTLTISNGSWDNIPDKIILNDDLAKSISKSARKLDEFPSICSGFKDPRMIFLLESWKPFLPENIIIVGIFRDPLKVAESLKKRNQFDYSKSMDLWRSYNEKLLRLLEQHPGFLLDFDWSKDRLLSEIQLISEKIGLARDIDLSKWYDQELVHGKDSDKNFKKSEEIENLYERLQKRSKENNFVQITKDQSLDDLRDALGGLLMKNQNDGEYFKQRFKKYEELLRQNGKLMDELNHRLEQETKIRDELVAQLQLDIQKLQNDKYEINQTLLKTTKELDIIKKSVIFNKMRTLAKIADSIAPAQTTRGKILKKILGSKI